MYSYVSMKRAEGVTKTYFTGNEWSAIFCSVVVAEKTNM